MRTYTAYAVKITAVPFVKKTKHYWGWMPELTKGIEDSVEMIRPTFLIIKALNDGFFLHYYTSKGQPLSDTWHQSLEDAKHQAEYEFNGHFSDWQEIATDIDDPVAYLVNNLENLGS